MRNIGKLPKDVIGLFRVCGFRVGMAYSYHIVRRLPSVLRDRHLMGVDESMGPGPFTVKLRCGERFRVFGRSVVSGIREMYVRDTYLRSGLLRIKDGDTVVDLGANIGNFTNLALAQGRNVRVVAVEPSLAMNRAFTESLGLNPGHLERAKLIRAFLGTPNEKISELTKDDVNYSGAAWVTEDELIRESNLARIDFLKCDIEGGEFGLLTRQSRLLSMTRFLAAEVHAFAGDVQGFLDDLVECGFELLDTQWASDGSCTVLARRK